MSEKMGSFQTDKIEFWFANKNFNALENALQRKGFQGNQCLSEIKLPQTHSHSQPKKKSIEVFLIFSGFM